MKKKLLIKGDVFRITLYALEFWWLEQQEGKKDTGQKTTTGQVTGQVAEQVGRLVDHVISCGISGTEEGSGLQSIVGIRHREAFIMPSI